MPFCYLTQEGGTGDSISGKDHHHPSHQGTTINLDCIGVGIGLLTFWSYSYLEVIRTNANS